VTTSTSERLQGFTDEQRRAVMTREVSVSLSAGAGCGKTFVLTERFLSHFQPGDDDALVPEEISRLVAITFTERAAREMRDRIRAKCYRRLLEAPQEHAAYWADLLRALDGARISTIHSFCASLLRSRAVEAGVDPRFAVLEPAQADTLLSESIDDEIRSLISRRDAATVDLAVRYGLDVLREMARRLVLEGTPESFQEWLAISTDERVARWEACAAELPPVLGRALALCGEAQTAWRLLRENVPSHETMRERRAVLLDTLERLQAGPSNREALGRLLAAIEKNARVHGGGRAESWPTPQAYDAFKKSAEDMREAARKMRCVVDFDPDQARPAAVLAGQLLTVADGVRRAYEKRKEELRVMDFDDLLVRTRRLLADEARQSVVDRLREHVTLLLVDEFQDTDPLQAELVESLAGRRLAEGKLFFVGDHKQSIYRFRGADPHVFRRLRERVPAAGRQSLSLNFRSQPAILHFVNALFGDDLGPGYEPLRPHREQVGPVPAVEFLWAPSDAECGQKEQADQLREREAEWIARRIRSILDGGELMVADSKASESGRTAIRAARPGDIAILLRALVNVDTYEAALRRHGIDYYLVGGHAFYAQQEIFDLLNLLRALDSPADEVSLIGALRSGFFSLADETIFWLAQHPAGVNGGLFAPALPEEIDAEQKERTARAARVIGRLRACKDRLRVCELVEMALALSGYDAALVGEFLGERKLANLVKLEEQARGFQRGDFLGLADFIAQLSEFVVRQPDEPLAAMHAEDANVVRLMSVHQAKGLEFPIVVVPDVNRQQREPWPPARFDVRLGPLVRGDGDDPAPSGFDLWRQQEKVEDAAETNRLLYVATTRAADYLILSGGVRAVGDASGPWAQLLARRFDLASGRFIGHLLPGEPQPAVKVTSQEPPLSQPARSGKPRVDLARLVADVKGTAASMEVAAKSRAVDPIGPDRLAPRQYSFSRLAGTLHRPRAGIEPAESDGEASPDPRGLGTLVHAALAAVDLAAPGNCRALVERLAERHLPDSPAEVDEAVAMVERFVKSARAREIAAADESHAEIEFLLSWPADGPRPARAALRGFIDRLYRDAAGGWHVVDFKTNRVAGEVARAAEPYEMQMLLYGLAAERILGSPPASLTLHFLRPGVEHSFAWGDAARQRVVALVNEAIKADAAGGKAEP
jgi:ATP-dependent helicase/nuclease subunit A